MQTSQTIKRILDHLQSEQVISAGQAAAAVAHHQRGGARIEEVLLELAIVDEPALLRSLATLYRTRFASSERLSSFAVDARLKDLVPRKYAEQYLVCPMTLDAESGVLTVVTPDAGDVGMLHGLRVAASARDVRALVVRPAAAKAMIAKVYAGDTHAFAILDREASARASIEPAAISRNMDSVRPSSMSRPGSIAPSTQPLNTPSSRVGERSVRPAFGSSPGIASSISTLSPQPSTPSPQGVESFRAVIGRIVAFYEARDPEENPDHAQHVARVVRVLCERSTVPLATAQSIELAALLHDVAKGAAGHLSTFNVAQYPEHAVAARAVYTNPLRLFEGAKLPVDVGTAIQHMYERFDGRGFPLGQRGRDIPLGARVLAVADAYADLTENPQNPYRRRLAPEEAAGVLVTLRETVLDPAILDVVVQAVSAVPTRVKLSPAWREVLVLDASPDDPFLLRSAALEAGFRLRVVPTTERARVALSELRYDLLLVDADDAPWSLLDDVQAGLAGPRIPFAAVGRTLDRATVERLGALRAVDISPKSLAPAGLFERLKQALDGLRAASSSAQRGRLQEVELADVLQGLVQGRKTGRLVVRAARGGGEIHFTGGAITDGFFGERSGDEAIVAMMRLREGDFAFDPAFRPGAPRIHTPTEMLLLEAMRRLDESSLRPR